MYAFCSIGFSDRAYSEKFESESWLVIVIIKSTIRFTMTFTWTPPRVFSKEGTFTTLECIMRMWCQLQRSCTSLFWKNLKWFNLNFNRASIRIHMDVGSTRESFILFYISILCIWTQAIFSVVFIWKYPACWQMWTNYVAVKRVQCWWYSILNAGE